MKLYEIVGGSHIRRADSISVPSDETRVIPNKTLQILGYGYQGMALNRPQKINTVTKVFGFDSEENKYLKFLKAIMNHNNPYLPVVRNLRTYKKSFIVPDHRMAYKFTGVVDMERLLPLTHPRIRKAATAQLNRLGVYVMQELDYDNLVAIYQEVLGNGKISRDAQFEEAVAILERIVHDTDNLDLHTGNVMVRLTSVGPQLVLVDPMWDQG